MPLQLILPPIDASQIIQISKNYFCFIVETEGKLVMDQELENLPRLIEQMESKIKIEKDTIAACCT
jgi:hypothetical protein